MKKQLWVSVVLVLIVGLICSSCASKSSPATVPAPSGSSPGAVTPPVNVLKIGAVVSFAFSMDPLKGIQALVEADNRNGGLDIGGKRYQIQFIYYDNGNSQSGEAAAVNKLIYEDKVKYIIGIAAFTDAWIQTTEAEKVISLTLANENNLALRPSLHYSFNGSYNNSNYIAFTGWFCQNNPEAIKKVVMAFPDSQLGHILKWNVGGSLEKFGITPTDIYFPAAQQDQSVLGTKVVNLGATSFMAVGVGALGNANIFKPVAQAGFKGQLFSTSPDAASTMLQVLTPQEAEGLLCQAEATEFDPALTQTAKDYKAIWTAKYGKWDNPDVSGTSGYYCLKAALQQAGTLDTDKVADVLANGMKYETVNGPAQMASRPDLGNNRTVDSASTTYIKKIHNGQPTLVSTLSVDDVIGYMRKAFPPLPPGATPPAPGLPGFPPGGMPEGPPGGTPPSGPPPG